MESLSKELGLTVKEIDNIYKAYWKAVYDFITQFPVNEIDDLNTVKHSISVLPLGKFFIDERRFKYLKDLYAKNKED